LSLSIKANNLTKEFGTSKALDNINLEIKSGQVFGILGPNGSGKTTFLKIIAGVLESTSGSVFINELNTSKDRDLVKKIVGYVPETPTLYESLTPREFLNFVASVRGINENKFKERAENFCNAFGLKDNLDEPIGSLSFGTKQKVAVIGAMLHDPEVLVLDEAMNGLDPKSSKILKTLLKDFAARGRCVIFSTHIMEVAEDLCDRLAILYKGKIITEGTLQDLKSGSKEQNLEDIFLGVTGQNQISEIVENLKEAMKN
jgi:ABC-2 type transport system ATP-binding protein